MSEGGQTALRVGRESNEGALASVRAEIQEGGHATVRVGRPQ